MSSFLNSILSKSELFCGKTRDFFRFASNGSLSMWCMLRVANMNLVCWSKDFSLATSNFFRLSGAYKYF